MGQSEKSFGQHYLVEMIGCDPEKIKYVQDVEKVLLQAAKKSQATIVKSFFHQYEPYGVTGIILISESHFSVHTWPEDNYAAFDILTCGEMFPERAIEDLELNFQAKEVRTKIITRGF